MVSASSKTRVTCHPSHNLHLKLNQNRRLEKRELSQYHAHLKEAERSGFNPKPHIKKKNWVIACVKKKIPVVGSQAQDGPWGLLIRQSNLCIQFQVGEIHRQKNLEGNRSCAKILWLSSNRHIHAHEHLHTFTINSEFLKFFASSKSLWSSCSLKGNYKREGYYTKATIS